MPNFSAIRTSSANDPARNLLHCVSALDFDAKFGGPQPSGNLPVEQAAHNKHQYFAFALRQRVVPCSLFGNLSLLLSICVVALDGLVNRIEQRLVAKRFGQK